MIAVCQQPNYFPWLGYLEQCARAEELVILDSVQWIRRGLQHRAKILSEDAHFRADSSRDFRWLSLALQSSGHREKPLREIELDHGAGWAAQHWGILRATYGSRPLFKSQFEPLVRPWFEKAGQHRTLLDVSLSSMRLCFEALELRPRIRLSSELPERGRKTDRLISLCRAVGADTYYSGLASSSYLDTNAFREADIRLVWQRFKCPPYAQGRDPFRSHLSVLDAFAHLPLPEIREMLAANPWGPFGNGYSASNSINIAL